MPQTRWTNDFLDSMMRTGDPLADGVIEHLRTHHGVKKVNELLFRLFAATQVDTTSVQDDADTCSVLADYLTQTARLPDWADPALIATGQKVFEEFGVMGFSLLGCSSLPWLYTAGRGGTQVLTSSGKLEWGVRRRLIESAQFVVNVLSAGGLDMQQGGVGIKTIQRVRLMHAAIRYLILSDPGDHPGPEAAAGPEYVNHPTWKQEWGVPINQETMGATILTFSYTILAGLRSFGIDSKRLTPAQEHAYLHTWSVIGHIMGIRDEFLTAVQTMEDAADLFNTVIARHRSRPDIPDEVQPGRLLTGALVDFFAEMIQQESWLGRFDGIRHMPKLLMIQLVGHENAHLLGIKLDIHDWITLFPFRVGQWLMARFLNQSSEYYRHADWLFRVMLGYLQDQESQDKGVPFKIPTHLQDGWGMHVVAEPAAA